MWGMYVCISLPDCCGQKWGLQMDNSSQSQRIEPWLSWSTNTARVNPSKDWWEKKSLTLLPCSLFLLLSDNWNKYSYQKMTFSSSKTFSRSKTTLTDDMRLYIETLRSYKTSPQLTSYSKMKSWKFSKIGNKIRMSILAIFICHGTGRPSQSI